MGIWCRWQNRRAVFPAKLCRASWSTVDGASRGVCCQRRCAIRESESPSIAEGRFNPWMLLSPCLDRRRASEIGRGVNPRHSTGCLEVHGEVSRCLLFPVGTERTR